MISTLFGILVYKFIIQPNKNNNNNNNNNPMTSFLFGFGIFIPLACIIPYWFLILFEIRNKQHIMGLMIIPLIIPFRVLEAMFGFAPPGVTKSLKTYTLYYTALMEPLFDSTATATSTSSSSSSHLLLSPTSWYHLSALVQKKLYQFIILLILFTILRPYSYEPFPTKWDSHSLDHSFMDLFHPYHLMNNFIAALMLSLLLSFSTNGTSIITNFITQIRTVPVVNNPMFGATSPSDFWGRRWNTLIHGALKRGVFKPVRKYYGRPIAILITFLISGIIHEYVWYHIFFIHDIDKQQQHEHQQHHPIVYGKNIIFFTWNGFLLLFEMILGPMMIQIQRHNLKLPKWMISILVLCTALPIGHLFTGDFLIGGYFNDFQIGFPIFIHIPK